MKDLSRREFFRTSAIYGGAVWLGVQAFPDTLRAAAASSQRQTLSAREWETLEAAADRILPRDETPGALDAGVVNFIDKALAHEESRARRLYQAGLAGLDAVAAQSGGASFAALPPEAQDGLLIGVEDGDAAGWPEAAPPSPVFFRTLHFHVLAGFLSDPRHGGNRDWAGWKLVGYPGPSPDGYTPAQQLGRQPIVPIWGARDA